MYDMLRNEIILCDKNEKNYFEKVGPSLPPTDQVKLNEWLSQSDTWDESTRTFTGNTTGNYSMFQNSSYNQITFYSLSGTLAGYATVGASTLTINFFAKV
jgi:hypothetical protein